MGAYCLCEDGRYHPDQVARYGLVDDRYFTPERLAMRMGLPPLMQDRAHGASCRLPMGTACGFYGPPDGPPTCVPFWAFVFRSIARTVCRCVR